MDVGDAVEVHTSFNDSWARGFEIAAIEDSGYRVRRTSDGVLLPGPTGPEDLRPTPRQSMRAPRQS